MSMNPELQAASSFLSSFLPSSPNPIFITHLHSLLSARYERHWHATDPERGSGFRSLVRSGPKLDQSIVDAADAAGISPADLASALGGAQGRVWLGDRWTLWVDPGCVCLRVERSEGGRREGQFVEIYGKLPESLSAHAVSLSSFERSSVNITTTTPVLSSSTLPTSSCPSSLSPPDSHLLSPTKRSSHAIQILRPPVRLSSPAPSTSLPLPHSPFIIPPTPLRPSRASTTDVFSPAPSHLGPNLFRRSSSRASSHSASSHSGSGSDGEDSLFSSTESLSSSSSGGRTPLWGTKVDSEFKYPPLPARSSSFTFPPTSSLPQPFAVPRSLPTSPTKPRRRGTRGGGSNSSITSLTSVTNVPNMPRHESSSSITSLSSITSATSTSRTREQAMQGTLTEHSGGKVGVLGGGVLLGLAGAKAMAGRELGEGKRRGRERRRGGRMQWGVEA